MNTSKGRDNLSDFFRNLSKNMKREQPSLRKTSKFMETPHEFTIWPREGVWLLEELDPSYISAKITRAVSYLTFERMSLCTRIIVLKLIPLFNL